MKILHSQIVLKTNIMDLMNRMLKNNNHKGGNTK